MSIRLPLTIVFALAATLAQPTVSTAEDRGIVLESHVGARPRDANYLLAPLLDELKRRGYKDNSVAGTRIESLHSLSPEQLSNSQIEAARRTIKDGWNAYINMRYEGAVAASTQGLAMLMSRPATMIRQQHVRDMLYEALITISLAQSRIGNEAKLEEAMGEFIRSFPTREVNRKRYGPDGVGLHNRISKAMSAQPKGELQVAAGDGSMVFINERYVGMGSLKHSLFPGRYRVYIQRGSDDGRVHIVEVVGDRKQTLVVDPVVDRSLRTDGGFVGFVFESEAERELHERRVTRDLGRAIGADNVILVGFHKHKGQDSIVARTIKVNSDQDGASARIPLPKNGAPPPAQLRSLATFVVGAGPAGSGIEVISVEPRPTRDGEQIPLAGLRASRQTKDTGISSAWRWTTWGIGLGAIGAGAYLTSIDGDGSCTLEPNQAVCPETYDTRNSGVGLIAAGTLLGLTGFYLWTQEADESTQLSMSPTGGGMSVQVSGRF